MLHTQLVDAPHQSQIGRRHGLRQVLTRASTDADQVGLPAEGVAAVDHHSALSMPALKKQSFH